MLQPVPTVPGAGFIENEEPQSSEWGAVAAVMDERRVIRWPKAARGVAGCVGIIRVQQAEEYDCGLACAAMAVLTEAGRRGALETSQLHNEVTMIYEMYRGMSGENTSIWTVDIFVLLDKLLGEVGAARPRLTTTVLGCNPMYVETDFYTENFLGDEVRVTRLFSKVKEDGYDVQERQLGTDEVTSLLATGDVLLIVLVDATLIPHTKHPISRVLDKTLSCISSLFCMQPRHTLHASYPPPPATTTFQGHYLVASGYDPVCGLVTTVDPSGAPTIGIPLGEFEHARSAFGTDNDVISVYLGK